MFNYEKLILQLSLTLSFTPFIKSQNVNSNSPIKVNVEIVIL